MSERTKRLQLSDGANGWQRRGSYRSTGAEVGTRSASDVACSTSTSAIRELEIDSPARRHRDRKGILFSSPNRGEEQKSSRVQSKTQTRRRK